MFKVKIARNYKVYEKLVPLEKRTQCSIINVFRHSVTYIITFTLYLIWKNRITFLNDEKKKKNGAPNKKTQGFHYICNLYSKISSNICTQKSYLP